MARRVQMLYTAKQFQFFCPSPAFQTPIIASKTCFSFLLDGSDFGNAVRTFVQSISWAAPLAEGPRIGSGPGGTGGILGVRASASDAAAARAPRVVEEVVAVVAEAVVFTAITGSVLRGPRITVGAD